METYAIVEDGTVTNMVLWDGDVTSWAPPKGSEAVKVVDGDGAMMGASYNGTVFTPPTVTVL